jgi:hypothetical protein
MVVLPHGRSSSALTAFLDLKGRAYAQMGHCEQAIASEAEECACRAEPLTYGLLVLQSDHLSTRF